MTWLEDYERRKRMESLCPPVKGCMYDEYLLTEGAAGGACATCWEKADAKAEKLQQTTQPEVNKS